MFVPFAIGKVVVLQLQAFEEIRIYITSVFVDELIFAVTGH